MNLRDITWQPCLRAWSYRSMELSSPPYLHPNASSCKYTASSADCFKALNHVDPTVIDPGTVNLIGL